MKPRNDPKVVASNFYVSIESVDWGRLWLAACKSRSTTCQCNLVGPGHTCRIQRTSILGKLIPHMVTLKTVSQHGRTGPHTRSREVGRPTLQGDIPMRQNTSPGVKNRPHAGRVTPPAEETDTEKKPSPEWRVRSGTLVSLAPRMVA